MWKLAIRTSCKVRADMAYSCNPFFSYLTKEIATVGDRLKRLRCDRLLQIANGHKLGCTRPASLTALTVGSVWQQDFATLIPLIPSSLVTWRIAF